MKSKLFILMGLLMVFSMVLSACQPQTIVETVVVEQEGETIIITATPEPEMPEADLDAIVTADGMVACNPLPELAMGTDAELASVFTAAPTGSKAFGTVSAEPSAQSDAVLKVGVFSDVTTINYFAANGPDNTVWNSYMLPNRLTLYQQADKYFTLVPAVAIDMPDPVAEDGDMWSVTIPIRQDIVWSDGTPLTANDVAYTSSIVKDFGLISGNWASWFDFANFLDHIEAVDDYTVKIVYHTKPGLARHEYGTLQSPILNAAYWEAKIAEAGARAPLEALSATATADETLAAQQSAQDILFAIDPDGEPLAGFYTFGSREAGAFLENIANPDYYDTGSVQDQWASGGFTSGDFTLGDTTGDPDLSIEIGPFVGSVLYTVYTDQNSAILALQAGEVDFILNSLGLQRGLAESVQNDPNLTVITNPTNGFRYLSFNARRRPMNDCSFRQAVAVLIDKEFVTSTILQNVAYPIYTFIPEGNAAWYYADTPKIGQGLSREQRINLAVQILENAGYTWEGDVKPTWDPDNSSVIAGGRLIMPDGTPVPNLNMLAPSPGYDPLRSTFAVWIETWLNEAGIPVTANLNGFNVLVPLIFTEQDFDMYILGWSLSVFPSFLRDFYSEEQAVPDGNNAGGYVSPEFEDLSLQMLSCDTLDSCKEIANQIQTLLATELPNVLLFDTGIYEAYRSAGIEFPYTEQLSGVQFTWNTGFAGTTHVK